MHITLCTSRKQSSGHYEYLSASAHLQIAFLRQLSLYPYPSCPPPKKTAEIMLNHVFHLQALPSDFVSDRGPQFTSQFWSKFCSLLGATVSLSSGCYQQSANRSLLPYLPDRASGWSPGSWLRISLGHSLSLRTSTLWLSAFASTSHSP